MDCRTPGFLHFRSVQFSHSVLSDSLQPHGLPNTRVPSVQFSSVTQSCLTLCNPMYCSRPVFSVYHRLLELAQTHVHWAIDPIQPSHPLWSPSPLALSLSQHQGLFQWVNSLHQVPQYWKFRFSINPYNEYSGLISFRIDWFDLLAVQGTLKSLSSITVWKHQLFGTHPFLWSNSHIHTWLLEKPELWLDGPVSAF